MGYIRVKGAPLIIMLGDSITEIASDPRRQGFQVQLTGDYVGRADVINRGISGWNTAMWLDVLPAMIDEWREKQPMLIVIFLGTNDASLPTGESKARYVPLDKYKENLHKLVASFSAAYPLCKYIFLSPPPVNNGAWSHTDKLNEVTAHYAAACLDVAKELKIPAVDFYNTMQGQWDLFYDGLHFSPKGMILAHELITKCIREAYPAMTPEALPHEFIHDL
ncbi:isoamyl acetate-hydrolyzing esterase 1 [Thraustotheca clavata]|uniref:Isoamyl acetate-hydrolyzing esterase 1 n=1 Tax=Thraustotheca clavata TaxID=74557 RepID=A0A1V9Z803_9STRA|nr:isoamyl acetate-hydrolyzing esterase 1 [Thraustotheca clavata]